MLTTLFPQSFRKYSSLAILGSIADGFASWLVERKYTRRTRRQMVSLLPYIEADLIRCGVRRLDDVSQTHLAACWKSLKKRFPSRASTARVLGVYLRTLGLVKPEERRVLGAGEEALTSYVRHLESVRGAARTTIQHHVRTAAAFLVHSRIAKHNGRLSTPTVSDVEGFVKKSSQRLNRASLRQTVAKLRGFLRFLATRGDAPLGLDRQIDSPRVYREEQLPRTLPWDTVQTLLRSIDRSSLLGLRDFTIFLLMATYGLRTSDIVALTLDDIHWRAGKISISQRKTGTVLELPLTDAVGTALLKYLKRVPPQPPFRQIFLRMRAPVGTLKTASISQAFYGWLRRSGLQIPLQGPSCIRHSYAVFLLRSGTPLKTIGDLLGHRSLESTCTYLRLAIEDLRDVALPVPSVRKGNREVSI